MRWTERGSVWCFRGVEGRTNIGSSATNCYTTPLLQIHQIHVRENRLVERFKREERKAFVSSSVHHVMMRQSTNLLNINPVTPNVHNGP